MTKSIIKEIYRDFKEKKHFNLPEHLLPAKKGCNLIKWADELFLYYRQEGIVVRPFDELPPFKLSAEDGLDITIQDIHKFIINDLNLISLETRKNIAEHAATHPSPQEAWQHISQILLEQIETMDNETAMEELSWKFSPVSEILCCVTWFFIEREDIVLPESTSMKSDRFPYYLWITEKKEQSLWAPENPLCRREWLALDLYQQKVLRNK